MLSTLHLYINNHSYDGVPLTEEKNSQNNLPHSYETSSLSRDKNPDTEF